LFCVPASESFLFLQCVVRKMFDRSLVNVVGSGYLCSEADMQSDH